MKSATFPVALAVLLAGRVVAFPLLARDASDADISRLAPELGITPGVPFGDGMWFTSTCPGRVLTFREGRRSWEQVRGPRRLCHKSRHLRLDRCERCRRDPRFQVAEDRYVVLISRQAKILVPVSRGIVVGK